MRRVFRTITVILFGLLLINTTLFAATDQIAATDQSAMADYLNVLGILKGTDEGYDLEEDLSRGQGAAMVVRLRGGEAEALEAHYSHPFTDVPQWADDYVGYMYYYGLTSGNSATLFGTNDIISIEAYVTFLLRTLMYDDKAGDFYWQESLQKAEEIGLLKGTQRPETSRFTRGEMVELTYGTLQTKMKSESSTLIEHLTKLESLSSTAKTANSFMDYEIYEIEAQPTNEYTLIQSIKKLAYEMIPTYTFDLSAMSQFDLEELNLRLSEGVSELPSYSSIIQGYRLSRKANTLTITMTYNVTKEQHELAIMKAKEISSEIITESMSDYEKEKAIHDYIVTNVAYDESQDLSPEVYTMYGALIKGSAVCHGYAESFRYLGYLAGLEAELVVGEAESRGSTIGHAWNIVILDGEAYHVDTTWDDPVGATQTSISYAYFNVTDEVLAKDHMWKREDYPECSATKYNYFTYEALQVHGVEGLKRYMNDGFDEGKYSMNVRVVGVEMSMGLLREVLIDCEPPYDISYKVNAATNEVTVTRDE